MLTIDPMALARRQIALDRTRTQRFAHTAERKVVRMRASPVAFLRGAAPLFYELMQAKPELAGGPPDEGWLVGDLHIENFGVFAAEAHGAEKAAAVFDVNDFDDCMIGPLRLDILRLATSLILAGRELAATGGQALEMVADLVDAWSVHAGLSGSILMMSP